MKLILLILINLIGNKNIQIHEDSINLFDLKNANTSLDSAWYSVKIDSVCRFIFPQNRLEFQNDIHRKRADSIYKQYNLPNYKKLVLQQKGLNDFKNGNYTRVLVEVINGNKDEFFNRKTKVISFKKEELEQLKNAVKSSYVNSLNKVNAKIIKWHYISITEINNSFCIRSKYDRKSAVDPLKSVTVDIYSFHDSNRIIELTFSSMKDDFMKWENDFKKIVSGFTIISN